MMFGGKAGKLSLTEAMKKKFGLVKKQCGYAITSISDPTVKVATKILTRKVMRTCHTNEVPTPVVSLVAQCTKEVQFN